MISNSECKACTKAIVFPKGRLLISKRGVENFFCSSRCLKFNVNPSRRKILRMQIVKRKNKEIKRINNSS
jgi:YHS domain-containing protein